MLCFEAMRRLLFFLAAFAPFFLAAFAALIPQNLVSQNLPAQNFDPHLYSGLQWRMIGPFRGGRTVGAAGIADQPNVFYIGVSNGGVWETDDYGRSEEHTSELQSLA